MALRRSLPQALRWRAMKTTYIFAAILIASVIGALVPTRLVKTLMLVLTGALAVYGLLRYL
jgi:hypothetical protein